MLASFALYRIPFLTDPAPMSRNVVFAPHPSMHKSLRGLYSPYLLFFNSWHLQHLKRSQDKNHNIYIYIYSKIKKLYKKDAKDKNLGYYDMYKNPGSTSDIDAHGFKRQLLNYWEDSVTEVEHAPQIEGAHFKVRWLYGGTNYRRMVEPLHIADFYNDSGKNYINGGKRPKQFVLLEQWQIKKQAEDKKKEEKKRQKEEEKKKREQDQSQEKEQKSQARPRNEKREKVSAILTEDSCFWTHVEEAIILCNLLKNEGSTTDAEKVEYKEKLKEFQAYVWDGLKNYAVSSEIFLGGSTFMSWWEEYEGVTGDHSVTELGQFKVNRSYLKYGHEDLSCSTL